MAYFLNCSYCNFQCEYIDPDDLCGASTEEAWEKPIACPRCGAHDELGQYWHYPSPMCNGGHHEEQIKLWETRWYPRNWRGHGHTYVRQHLKALQPSTPRAKKVDLESEDGVSEE